MKFCRASKTLDIFFFEIVIVRFWVCLLFCNSLKTSTFAPPKLGCMKYVGVVYRYVRIVTGIIITLHGLLRIIFINTYVDFVQANFSDIIPSENILVIGATLFPFVEFFTGLLITMNLKIRQSLVMGALISIVMSYYIVVGHLYIRLIYHVVVCSAIALLYFMLLNSGMRKQLIRANETSN